MYNRLQCNVSGLTKGRAHKGFPWRTSRGWGATLPMPGLGHRCRTVVSEGGLSPGLRAPGSYPSPPFLGLLQAPLPPGGRVGGPEDACPPDSGLRTPHSQPFPLAPKPPTQDRKMQEPSVWGLSERADPHGAQVALTLV